VSFKRRRSKLASAALGPPAPFTVPQVPPGTGCAIVFGHNATIHKVMMQFSVSADQFVFSPEEARAVAKNLLHYADMADGTKTQG
jgi:hypothetical protein